MIALSSRAAALVAACAVATALASASPQGAVRSARAAAIGHEIARLSTELAELAARERGVLDELTRLGAELRLADARARRSALEIEALDAELATRETRLDDLEARRRSRQAWLAERERARYREGPAPLLRRMLSADRSASWWAGARYAARASQRDAAVARGLAAGAAEVRRESAALAAAREQLGERHARLARERNALAGARAERERVLAGLERDGELRQGALTELHAAAEQLAGLAGGATGAAPTLDVRKFRGLLDWPTEAPIRTGFGSARNPRFGTTLPHPGLALAAELGAPFRAAFEGRTLFAARLRGYGLTAIVDHGGGLVTVYAHASALLVERGQPVEAGRVLGRVGEDPLLGAPSLYFELRVDGTPQDPRDWLRRRPDAPVAPARAAG